MTITKEQLVQIIVDRIEKDADILRADFNRDKGATARSTAIDNLFPDEIAHQIYQAFPARDKMRMFDSFREKKYTSKDFNNFDPLIRDTTFAFQDQRVIDAVEKITGQKDAVGDPHLYAGGISAMAQGHFLNPHIDNSHDGDQKYYRVLNLLYYVTPDWKAENGGNLELWDIKVKDVLEIPSLFNRLVLMETHDKSWHSVNEVKVDGLRCCVSNYYFSPHSPNGYETSHITFFQARPEQKLRRLVTTADGYLRTAVRKVVKQGLGKKDIYEGGEDNKK